VNLVFLMQFMESLIALQFYFILTYTIDSYWDLWGGVGGSHSGQRGFDSAS